MVWGGDLVCLWKRYRSGHAGGSLLLLLVLLCKELRTQEEAWQPSREWAVNRQAK